MVADAVLQSLAHVWALLDSIGCPTALMGGMALSAWKHVRATQDVDLLVCVSESDEKMVMERLLEAGLRPRSSTVARELGDARIAQFLYEPPGAYMDVRVDLFFGRTEYHREAMRRKVAVDLPMMPMRVDVLTAEDLILHKLVSGRMIDLSDVSKLMEWNRETLDLDYLAKWSEKLGVRRELKEGWARAFPDDDPPTSWID